MSDSQAYLQESPEATRTPAMWSDCPIVALVWLVCLALSIHALREEVNTIIDFMMVSSPLEQHKALYILTNERQHQTQCGRMKAVAHKATNSRIWQGRTSWQDQSTTKSEMEHGLPQAGLEPRVITRFQHDRRDTGTG